MLVGDPINIPIGLADVFTFLDEKPEPGSPPSHFLLVAWRPIFRKCLQPRNQIQLRVFSRGPFGVRELRNLCSQGRFEFLSLTKQPLIMAKVAKELTALSSVRSLWLWCPTTRTALRHVISIPGLEILDILEIRYPGALENFSEATQLKEFRCNGSMSEDDLLEVSRLPNLEELAAQNASLSTKALDAILGMSRIRNLDLEATALNDNMAAVLATSSTIETLEIGATRVTAKGLRSICTMSQLRSLDIWALDIQEKDLEILGSLPNLERLSLGGYDGQTTLTSKGVLPRLAQLPSLKRIWLDGIALSSSERAALEERYEYVLN